MASLGFVCGLLLGNCGYQTDRKKDLLGTCRKLAGGEGGGNRGSQLFETAEKGGVVKKWVMQICVRDHVEVHPQKKKEVLYFVQNTWEKSFSSPEPLGLICNRPVALGRNGKYEFFHWLKRIDCAEQIKNIIYCA